MASNNMHNLTTLIKRLEAATSRLEDMATTSFSSNDHSKSITPSAPSVVSTGTTTKAAPETPTVIPPTGPAVPASIEAFDLLVNTDVEAFVQKSRQLGDLVAEQASSVLKAFAAERKFLLVTTKSKKPDISAPIYMEILKDLQAHMEAVNVIRVTSRGSSLSNHLNTVSEGIAMLGWITIEPKPADYVNETLNSAQFYGNRLTKEYKDKDPKHVDWAKSFYAIFRSLASYIKEYHAMGVSWNYKEGVDPKEALAVVEKEGATTNGTSAPAPPAAGGPPPPPPPPPPDMDILMAGVPTSGAAKGSPSDMGSVFDQLSKGEAVTSGLRKVDPSEQTHKNPSLRTQVAVPQRSDSQTSLSSRGKSPAPGRPSKPQSMRTKKPPRKELEGNKWLIENFDSPSELIEIQASISHSILVTRCEKATIRVIGKANAISIDSSSRVSLVIDSLVSSVDVIKTSRFEMQVLGTLPTILLDQVDGATLYLSRESLGTEIFTSKCTAVNISVPGKTEDDDYKDCPVPEQIKTVIRNGVAVSEIVEYAG